MKFEFIVLAAVGQEVKWLRNLLMDMELWPQPMPTTSLHYDGQATISKAFGKVYPRKSRQLALRHEYIRQLISYGVITVVYAKSSNNLVDLLTKTLVREMVKNTIIQIGLKLF